MKQIKDKETVPPVKKLKKSKVKEAEPPLKKTIGILAERSLHAALKKWYAREGDRTEVPLEGFHIDLVRGDLLIEIQTRNFYALKRKLPKLLETHRLRLVHPIAVEKWLVRVAADGVTELSRRRSPKHGTFEDIFDELVHVPTLLTHPNFSLDILLVCQEEIRRVRKVLEKPAKRTRFYRDWDRHDHRLLKVLDSRLIESLNDLRAFLPRNLPPQFTNRELSKALGNNYRRAQSMTYVMRQIGILKIAGKRGRSDLVRNHPVPRSKSVRQILHLDLDAFYATVEMLLNPALRGKPVIVSMGDINTRGVVATCSYEARKFGVHSAMSLRQAQSLCPQAIIVPARHKIYSEHSQRVMGLLHETSPLVEQVSIDEAYLEIGPERDGIAVAREIQTRIHEELHLSCTIAVASNKLVSKIACNTVKPRGFIVVPDADKETFLAPLPVGKIPGAGHVTRGRLKTKWNVETIADLAKVPAVALRAEFGKMGGYLSDAAHGWDDSPIVTDRATKSISQENTFDRDVRTRDILEKYLDEMSEGIARELVREELLARTIVLKLRYEDFTTMTRQTTLRVPTTDGELIRKTARDLLTQHWDSTRAVRLLGVGVHNLVENQGTWQLELL